MGDNFSFFATYTDTKTHTLIVSGNISHVISTKKILIYQDSTSLFASFISILKTPRNCPYGLIQVLVANEERISIVGQMEQGGNYTYLKSY